MCEEWSSYENFYRDMGDLPPDKYLCRKNLDAPFSKENTFYGDEPQRLRKKHKHTYYADGVPYEHAEQAAKALGIPYSTFINRCADKKYPKIYRVKNKS